MKEGNLKVILQQGNSLDPRHKHYTYWRLAVEVDKNKSCVYEKDGKIIVEFTPRRDEFYKIIEEFLIHEAATDIVRRRKPDLPKYKETLNKLHESIQLRLKQFEVPTIYTDFEKKEYQETVFETNKK